MNANLTTFVFDQHFVKSHLIIIIIIYISKIQIIRSMEGKRKRTIKYMLKVVGVWR